MQELPFFELTRCSFEWDEEENVIRLISARLATALEKARYEYGEDNFE